MYGLGSTVLFGAVVSSTLKARPNFYSAAVALGMSSGASLVLANFALFNAIWMGVVLKKLFFGQLRSVEYEVSPGYLEPVCRCQPDLHQRLYLR